MTSVVEGDVAIHPRVTFRLRDADLLAFTDHVLERSRTVRKSLQHTRRIVPLILAALSLLVWLGFDQPVPAVVIAGCALFWLIWAPHGLRRAMRQRTLQQQREEGAHEFYLTQTLTARPDALHVQTELSDCTFKWVGMARVDRTDDHLFILRSGTTAYIVPSDTVGEAEFDAFAQACAAHVEAASAPPSRPPH